MDKVPITRRGFKALNDRLRQLRRVERPRVLEELREARGFGVTIDNQQYLIARERHLVLQRRIEDLSERIGRCEIFVGRKFHYRQAGFGTRVTIRNADTGESLVLRLVGPFESDPSRGLVSIESPVGRRLLGCFEGDAVTVAAPAGRRTYLVLAIDD